MKKIWSFIKRDAVLTAAWVLAAVSAFIVPPDAGYVGYVDLRSLGILWSLMVIMQVFRDNGIFVRIGSLLLSKTGSVRSLAAVLVFLCFISSMLITNDVALITFVPFAVLVLRQCGSERLIMPTLVLQTVAANLGSMLTPVGNPQNLYLYGISGMSMRDFVVTMLPYTLLAAGLLAVCVLLLRTGKGEAKTVLSGEQTDAPPMKAGKLAVFGALFALALLTVLRVVPYYVLAAAVLAGALIFERRAVKEVDYALLLTFVGFFIFTGNMARVPVVSEALRGAVGGHEVAAGVLVSQCISNVPAALLLSGFTGDYSALLLGVNIGGLGTLIASMASLISYKQFAREFGGQTKRYLLRFTAVNLVFLGALLALRLCLTGLTA